MPILKVAQSIFYYTNKEKIIMIYYRLHVRVQVYAVLDPLFDEYSNKKLLSWYSSTYAVL